MSAIVFFLAVLVCAPPAAAQPAAKRNWEADWKQTLEAAKKEGKVHIYAAQNPWLAEAARLNPYAQKILINARTAGSKGIKDRDRICVESSVGKVFGMAKVTQCIHPEAIGISSHFGSLCQGKPVAYGQGANLNKLLPFDTDPVSTGVDACVKVNVYKVSE